MAKILVPTTAVAMLAALAPAAQAKAPRAPTKPPKVTRVVVDAEFSFDYTTKWDAPRHWSYKNCYRTEYREGKGSEDVSLKSRRPVRLQFTVIGREGTLGLPDEAIGAPTLKLGGKHKREHKWRAWTEPGTCGENTGPMETPQPKRDCGTRLPNYQVTLLWSKRLSATITGDEDVKDRSQEDFDNCPVFYPSTSIHEDWNDLLSQKLSASTILGKKSFTVGDKMKWSEEAPKGAPSLKTDSKLDWKVKFTRVRRATRAIPGG